MVMKFERRVWLVRNPVSCSGDMVSNLDPKTIYHECFSSPPLKPAAPAPRLQDKFQITLHIVTLLLPSIPSPVSY
jgi:hypothetical protein